MESIRETLNLMTCVRWFLAAWSSSRRSIVVGPSVRWWVHDVCEKWLSEYQKVVERLHDFFWRRGCVILFVESLRDFGCGEFTWFLCFCLWRLRDFVCGEVACRRTDQWTDRQLTTITITSVAITTITITTVTVTTATITTVTINLLIMSVTKCQLQNGSHKMSVTKCQLQNFSYTISVTKFELQNFSYKIIVTKF